MLLLPVVHAILVLTMMTMMMMMIDDMLSPYMYLPDVPYLPSASCLLLFALAVAASAAALGSRKRERDPPCRSMPWGSHTGRTHLPDVGVRWRLPFVSPASHVSHTITHSPTQSQSHTHTHTHTHSLTLPLRHRAHTTLHHPEAARRGGDAILAQTSV